MISYEILGTIILALFVVGLIAFEFYRASQSGRILGLQSFIDNQHRMVQSLQSQKYDLEILLRKSQEKNHLLTVENELLKKK